MRWLCGLAVVAACGGDDGPRMPDQFFFGGDRLTELRVPASYDPGVPAPLLLSLHGYSATGLVEAGYMGLTKLVDEQGVLLLAPDGTEDDGGQLFWNVVEAGCQIGSDPRPDDIAYLTGLVAEVSAVWNVDPKRVYLFGHSNGAFMSYLLACRRPDLFASIITLAGSPQVDPAGCDPSTPVSLLAIHGDADKTVLYEGAAQVIGATCPYTSARAGTARWAGYDGCAGTTTEGERLDLVRTLDGAETRVERHDGCPAGLGVELWTIEGGDHIPVFHAQAYQTLWGFWAAHPR